jgi:hypothetical protein
MSTSPFSALTESITKEATAAGKAIFMFSDQVRAFVRSIGCEDRLKEIERMEEEALAKANEEAAGEVIPFDVMLEKMEEFDRECRCITRQEASMFWGEDAQLFSEKMAARQSEITRAMKNESARQAMKRRKLMHAEGHFPDSILLGGKAD